jgi:hypothetical protein
MVKVRRKSDGQSKVVALETNIDHNNLVKLQASILRRIRGRFRKNELFLLHVATKEYFRRKWSSQIFQYVVVLQGGISCKFYMDFWNLLQVCTWIWLQPNIKRKLKKVMALF